MERTKDFFRRITPSPRSISVVSAGIAGTGALYLAWRWWRGDSEAEEEKQDEGAQAGSDEDALVRKPSPPRAVTDAAQVSVQQHSFGVY